ncbi:hypothetical protein BsWGS_11926 [Bradybaena similaris]
MQPRVFLLFVAVINVGVCLDLDGFCSNGWKYFEGICYFYGNTNVTWEEAKAKCQSLDSTLAEVPSEDVNVFLGSKIVYPHYDDCACAWLGGNDFSEEGTFKWASGVTPFSFTYWWGGEPNNAEGGQDCLQLLKRYNYMWDDTDCHKTCNYICQRKVSIHIPW